MGPNSEGAGADIIDAEYIVVDPEPRVRAQVPRAVETSTASSGMDMLRQIARARSGQRERGGPLFWAGGIALAAVAFWVSGGHELAHGGHAIFSPAAPLLRIVGFNSRVVETGVRPSLVIDGEAVNDGAASAELPSIEIQVTSGNGTLTRYKLGTAGAELAAGDVFPFSGRLDLPKHGVKTVSVAFVE